MKLSIKDFNDNSDNYFNYRKCVEHAIRQLQCARLYCKSDANQENFVSIPLFKLKEIEFID